MSMPDGLQAIAFVSTTGPQIETCVLLCWDEGGKSIAKVSDDLSIGEMERFNPFILSSADILVVNALDKVVYVWSPETVRPTDPEWTYKCVSISPLLGHITKRMTLEELDAAAESEQKARDKLVELRLEVERERARADRWANACERLMRWIEPIATNRLLNLLERRHADQLRTIRRVLKDRRIDGTTLVGLIENQRDPIDYERSRWIGLREKRN